MIGLPRWCGTILVLYLFWRVNCARERLFLGMAFSYNAFALVRLYLPNLLTPATGVIRTLSLFWWIVATLVSLYFVASAFGAIATQGEARGPDETK
jgi:hypothetical protein